MNNSYISYIRNRDPIKFIFNIFRNYKKSCEVLQEQRNSVKRNQSAPAFAHQELSEEKEAQKGVESQSCAVEPTCSQDSLKVTWSNANFGKRVSYMNLAKKKTKLDTSIKEKLEEYPVPTVHEPLLTVKPMYPWQNYNIDSLQLNKKFNKIKSVSNLSSQMLSMRKSILKKTKPSKKSPPREVTFKKTASMLVYPKCMRQPSVNVMRQPSVNLSTDNKGVGSLKRKWDDGSQHERHHLVYPNGKQCRKFTDDDGQYGFPCFENKRQKVR